MSATRQNGYLACLLLHFTLIGTVCVHETLWLLKEHVATIPLVRPAVWETLDKVPGAILGNGLQPRNLWREALATYTNALGIEVGYGYFAPNIPATHALVFECHYPDGRVDYEKPTVRGKAAQLRLTTLIEQGRPILPRPRIITSATGTMTAHSRSWPSPSASYRMIRFRSYSSVISTGGKVTGKVRPGTWNMPWHSTRATWFS
jgi:hypothetical protein